MGFKKTSEVIAISNRIEESAANTFTEQQYNLNLDALNNEVFVVLAIDAAPSTPDFIPGTNTADRFQLSSTSQTAITGLETSNVLLRVERTIQSPTSAAGDSSILSEQRDAESVQAVLDYVAIIATDNFFAQIEGANNGNVMACAFRMWGYRAKADAATYAALVQSEVLSS